MKRSTRSKARIAASAVRLSDTALANFLEDLSEVHRAKDAGNAALANSLFLLAKAVRRKHFLGADEGSGHRPPRPAPKEKLVKPVRASADMLSSLTTQDVEAFLKDMSKTKNELLDLAAARFSMPTSQLKRLKSDELRGSIQAALDHEHSIDILSSESKRDGTARSS